MVINWYGEGCFKIQTGGVTVVTDPFISSIGLTPPRFKADIVIKTLAYLPVEYKDVSAAIISGPGEYEVGNIEISGFPIEAESGVLKTAYLVKTEEGLRLGILGHLSQNPKPDLFEALGAPDLLFIPAGGSPYLSQSEAAKLIKQINPKIVVASFFKIPNLAGKVSDIKEFLKETSQKSEPEESLTIKKKDLPASLKVAVLKV